MKLENEFTVDVPVDEVWNVLTNLERITPCLPGAQLTEELRYHYITYRLHTGRRQRRKIRSNR